MKQNSIAGAALIAGVLGFVLTMAFHPTGSDFAGGSEALARATHRAVGSHGLALVSIPVTLFGFLGLSRWLGLQRAPVSAALILYAISAAALLCAALFSGFVAPDLIRKASGAEAADPLAVRLHPGGVYPVEGGAAHQADGSQHGPVVLAARTPSAEA